MKRQGPPEMTLAMRLRVLKLPSFVAAYEALARQAEREGWPAGLTEALGAPRDYAIVARRS